MWEMKWCLEKLVRKLCRNSALNSCVPPVSWSGLPLVKAQDIASNYAVMDWHTIRKGVADLVLVL